MLTETLPFAGTSATTLALQIVQAAAPAPSTVNKSLPREDPIVLRALAKSLDQRYESAATLAAELRSLAAILDVRSESAAPASAPAALVPPRRSVAGWIALLLLLAALAAAWFERTAIERMWRRTMAPAPSPARLALDIF